MADGQVVSDLSGFEDKNIIMNHFFICKYTSGLTDSWTRPIGDQYLSFIQIFIDPKLVPVKRTQLTFNMISIEIRI
jgi:hypothetical protein